VYPALAPDILAGQFVVLLAALLSWSRGERRFAALAWLVLLGAMFCLARRNALLCSVTSLVVLAENARSLLPEALLPAQYRWRSQRLLRPAVLVILLGLFVKNIPFGMTGPAYVPVDFAAYLASLPPGARVFNEYNQSPYLEWRLAGHPPLFIDQVNAYPDNVLRQYLAILGATPASRPWLNRNVDVIAVGKPGPGDVTPPLFSYLQDNPNWALSFDDETSIAWTRVKAGGH